MLCGLIANFVPIIRVQLRIELCSSPNTKHSRPTEITNLPLRYLSHTELLFLYKTYQSILQPPFSFPPPSKTQSAKFWVKIFIPNHCKSSGSKFLHSSSIKYQVMYHLNSSHFADFWYWFVWIL